MNNLPKVKIGIVAVSRDCFPESLSVNRRKALVEAYKAKYGEEDIYECPVCIVESEIHMVFWRHPPLPRNRRRSFCKRRQSLVSNRYRTPCGIPPKKSPAPCAERA